MEIENDLAPMNGIIISIWFCIEQEGVEEEEEAVIKWMLQGGVLVAGAWGGEVIRMPVTIIDLEVMAICNAVHDKENVVKRCIKVLSRGSTAITEI